MYREGRMSLIPTDQAVHVVLEKMSQCTKETQQRHAISKTDRLCLLFLHPLIF